MNAASILKFFIKKKIIKINKNQIYEIAKDVGSDVILGLENSNSILTAKNKIKRYRNCRKLFILVVKPNIGCSTKYIYSKVKRFEKAKFNQPSKAMFNLKNLKRLIIL